MKTTLREQLRKIAGEFKVTLRFANLDKEIDGEALGSVITVKRRLLKARTVSVFFHELAHVICQRENKFSIFHNHTITTKSTLAEIERIRRAVLRTALRAEKYVDFLGEVLAGQHFPDIEYIPSYQEQDAKAWIRGYWDGWFARALRWRKSKYRESNAKFKRSKAAKRNK